MSETTPGPWMIDPGEGPTGDGWNEPRDEGYPPSIYVEHEGNTVEIARMSEPFYAVPLPDDPNSDPYETGDRYLGNMSANARLIAAAPDLLVALKVVVTDWVDQFERQGHTAPAWCQQATAAILKAEGPPK